MSKEVPPPLLPYRGNCGGSHYPEAPAVSVEELCLTYDRGQTHALNKLSLSVKRGQRIALVGENGSGKSTLLKYLSGMINADSGSAETLGHRPGVCRHEVAYLPQHSSLEWDFPISVERFVLTGSYVRLGWFRRPGLSQRERAQEVIADMGLSDLAQRLIGNLSGGQQQRCLLARTLLHSAELYLLDEPFNAVDDASRVLIWEALDRLRASGSTILMATHDVDRFADRFDRVVTLSNGRILDV
ncbi:MAG: ABC transporter ATP-binding protein [Verrucomicrobiota bacterium]